MLLGTRASGKTAFMQATQMMLSEGYNGYVTDRMGIRNKKKVRKDLQSERVRMTMLTNTYQMPLNKKKFLRKSEPVYILSWIDYRGESIVDGGVDWVSLETQASDGIILFVDGELYVADKKKSLYYTDILFGIVNNLIGPCPPIAVVCTKCDKIDYDANALVTDIWNYFEEKITKEDVTYNVFASSTVEYKEHPPVDAVLWLSEVM